MARQSIRPWELQEVCKLCRVIYISTKDYFMPKKHKKDVWFAAVFKMISPPTCNIFHQSYLSTRIFNLAYTKNVMWLFIYMHYLFFWSSNCKWGGSGGIVKILSFLISRAPPKPEIPKVTTKPVHSMYQNNANSNGSNKNFLSRSLGLAPTYTHRS